MQEHPHLAPDAALGSSAKWSWVTMGGCSSSVVPEAVTAIMCFGLDLANTMFAIRNVDDVGKAVLAQAQIPHTLPLTEPSNLQAGLVGMQAC